MDYINNFVITLVATMIFMTAVEIISPDNSMKKYIKFVLGLILISVMINPIVIYNSFFITLTLQDYITKIFHFFFNYKKVYKKRVDTKHKHPLLIGVILTEFLFLFQKSLNCLD